METVYAFSNEALRAAIDSMIKALCAYEYGRYTEAERLLFTKHLEALLQIERGRAGMIEVAE